MSEVKGHALMGSLLKTLGVFAGVCAVRVVFLAVGGVDLEFLDPVGAFLLAGSWAQLTVWLAWNAGTARALLAEDRAALAERRRRPVSPLRRPGYPYPCQSRGGERQDTAAIRRALEAGTLSVNGVRYTGLRYLGPPAVHTPARGTSLLTAPDGHAWCDGCGTRTVECGLDHGDWRVPEHRHICERCVRQ